MLVFGDPYGNRTHVTTVKGWCLNRLTKGPQAFGELLAYILTDAVRRILLLVAAVRFEPTTCRV